MITSLTQDVNVTNPTPNKEEVLLETSLRPQNFTDYIGQSQIKDALQITLQAAKERGEPVEPVLLYGPPGLGKTTLAGVIAKELGSNIKITAGPIIHRGGDLAAILTGLEKGDVLFIDEIHRIPPQVEEVLYPVMEDGVLDIMIGKGVGARSVRIEIPPITIIGATTKPHMLSQPLKDRFGHQYNLDYYSKEELKEIIRRTAFILNFQIDQSAMEILATRSRFTPRIANRLLKRVRDYAQVYKITEITEKEILKTFKLLNLDDLGLDKTDRMFLSTIIERFGGGPVGIESIAASCGENPDTLSAVHEPFLLKIGLIVRTPQGRKITELGIKHLSQ